MRKIKKNDIVLVRKGKDSGKTGKVLSVSLDEGKILVEGINFVKKATRKTRQDQQGGIIQKEAPVSIANVALFCKRCNKGTRVGVSVLSDGSKSRVCKKCNEVF